MKKLFFSLLAICNLFVVACSDEMSEPAVPQNQQTQLSWRLSYDEALKIAQNGISMIEEDKAPATVTRSDNGVARRTLNLNDGVKLIKASATTRADGNDDAEDGDTLMYVFNFDDNRGFALVSANRATEGLIAVTDSGHYDPATPIDNPGLAEYIDQAKNYVKSARVLRIPPTIHPNPMDTINRQYVTPRLNLKWGQNHPEGELCPNGLSGCVNVAIAMSMAYLRYPASINLTYPNADVSSVTFDWNAINGHIQGSASYYVYDDCLSITHTNIARLCRQLGYLTGSSYGTSLTSTIYANAKSAIENLGFSTSELTTTNTFPTLLQQGKLILVFSNNSTNTSGHCFIVDGCKYFSIYTYNGYYEEEAGLWVITDEKITSYSYQHINWGWYGVGNGYFSGFNALNAYRYDDVAPDANQDLNYNYNKKFLTIYHE